jgi:hypothetical protein
MEICEVPMREDTPKKKTASTAVFFSAEGEIWTPDQGLMSLTHNGQ